MLSFNERLLLTMVWIREAVGSFDEIGFDFFTFRDDFESSDLFSRLFIYKIISDEL